MNVYTVVKLCVDVEGARIYCTMYWAVCCLGCLLKCIPYRTVSLSGGLLPPWTPPFEEGGACPLL